MMRQINVVQMMAILLCFSVLLSGCGIVETVALKSDPVAEDYLIKMLAAIENTDVDGAYSLFAENTVQYDDIEKSMEVLKSFWGGGEYTYELVYVGVRQAAGTSGKKVIKERTYRVTTTERDYLVEVNYYDDETGLAGFRINLPSSTGNN